MGMIKKMWELLAPREKMEACGLLVLFLMMSVTEVVGIASLLPFMSVLSNPASVQTNKYLRWAYETFNFTDTTSFLFFIGVGVFIVLVVSNLIKAGTRWATLTVTQSWGESLGRRLFDIYLHQPYEFFLGRNSSDLSKNILAEVHAITSNILMAFLDMVTKLAISVVIIVFLAVIDIKLAIGAAVILGGAYVGVYAIFRKTLRIQAQKRTVAMAEKFKVVNEAIQGIKNIKLGGYERLYNSYFAVPAQTFGRTTANSNVIGDIPRYAMEVIGFGGVLLMLLYMLMHNAQTLTQAMPIIAVYVFAAYRLLPGLQGVYYGYTKLKFNKPVLEIIRRELAYAESMQPEKDPSVASLPCGQSIELRDIVFRYDDTRDILKGINLSIPANSMVGIVGKTGAGKTTMVDIILGLLKPSAGEVVIDGVAVTDTNRAAWQKNLSYVSQHIYLCDDTIAANIAFGLRPEDVDMQKVRQAAKMASLSQFIETELPKGYDTQVGENGIRLSGGQRQRLGLARALYTGRPVLVLDEATSALDPETEEDVMRSIHELDNRKTILIISHKMELLSKCDFIAIVQGGTVVIRPVDKSIAFDAQGIKNELLAYVGAQA